MGKEKVMGEGISYEDERCSCWRRDAVIQWCSSLSFRIGEYFGTRASSYQLGACPILLMRRIYVHILCRLLL